ncbi:hypothetical protein GCM10010353_46080 [Streptomyces chryseus]|nr:hypothetical protein GCM10010353_46080 [Streptomyces chryseus]
MPSRTVTVAERPDDHCDRRDRTSFTIGRHTTASGWRHEGDTQEVAKTHGRGPAGPRPLQHARAKGVTALTQGSRTGPQCRAWRILNRPNPMVPEIRILGPPGRECRRLL